MSLTSMSEVSTACQSRSIRRRTSANSAVPEGDTVTVTLDLDPERQVVIPIMATAQGGAGATDYTVAASVTFNSGDTEQTITFTAAQDTDNDDGESVLLAIGASLPAGVSAGATDETVVSITDDDVPQVTVMFGAATYTALEGGTATITVTLNLDPERQVVIPIMATAQGGAGATDYTVAASVTFNSGDTEQTITFTAAMDMDNDDGESVLLAIGASLPAGVSAGATDETVVSITDGDVPQVTVSFGAGTYTVAEGGTATITVTLNLDPERQVVIPIMATDQGGAGATDYTVPASVTFNSGDTEQTITFTAATDTDSDDGESTLLAIGTSLPSGVSAGTLATTTVSITDVDRRPRAPGDNAGRSGTVVTIARIPEGTVIPDHSSLWVGTTVEDNSTFVEGTRALFRLQFEAVGGGPAVGAVDVDLSYDWRHDSPLVTTHAQVVRTAVSLYRVDVWDTAVQIHDNDVGHPDGTVTIRITGCSRNGCIVGTPSELTLTIAADDGGPAAAVPGPPSVPRLVCARSGDGYDDTGIAVSWKAPTFVGGAPVESYELRYRQSSQFLQGRLILHPWEYWPGRLAATSTILTGLVTRLEYSVQVRAVNRNGGGPVVRAVVLRGGPDSRSLRNHRPVDPVGARRARDLDGRHDTPEGVSSDGRYALGPRERRRCRRRHLRLRPRER